MNAIVEALAIDAHKRGGVNLDSADKSREKYLQCATVSLISLKNQNPNDEVIFATNVDISEPYKSILNNSGVITRIIPFDDFIYPDDIQWGLAYYKLCALKSIVNSNEYENIMLFDTDIWCQRSLQCFWEEVSGGGIYMINLHASLDSDDRQSMVNDASKLFNRSFGNAACWGGELIAGKLSDLKNFLQRLSETYLATLKKKVFSQRGDEFLVFASQSADLKIYPANAYALRLWTGRFFTPCRHESLVVLHLPAEKDHAFEKAFRRLKGTGALPPNQTFLKWSGLNPSNRPFSPVWIIERGWSKLKGKFA